MVIQLFLGFGTWNLEFDFFNCLCVYLSDSESQTAPLQ